MEKTAYLGAKREEGTGVCRRLHSEEINDLYLLFGR